MISIDDVQDILDDLAEELPVEFYDELNGGILLLPEAKPSPYAKGNDLFILGEYRHELGLGRYIVIYYGSFERVFGNLPLDELIQELRITLRHEFTHHLESLAGEDDLDDEDAEYLRDYLEGRAYPR
jgi:hypothetical protein